MILTEAGLKFRERGILFTVNEKLLKCSLFHYLGNEWKTTDWTEIFIDQIKSSFFQKRKDNGGSPIFWNVTTEKREIYHLRDRGR